VTAHSRLCSQSAVQGLRFAAIQHVFVPCVCLSPSTFSTVESDSVVERRRSFVDVAVDPEQALTRCCSDTTAHSGSAIQDKAGSCWPQQQLHCESQAIALNSPKISSRAVFPGHVWSRAVVEISAHPIFVMSKAADGMLIFCSEATVPSIAPCGHAKPSASPPFAQFDSLFARSPDRDVARCLLRLFDLLHNRSPAQHL